MPESKGKTEIPQNIDGILLLKKKIFQNYSKETVVA